MSIFDMLFGKKPSPYELNPSDPDYDYYAGLRASEETAQGMLHAVNGSNTMPPLIVPDVEEEKTKVQAVDNVPKTLSEPPVDAEDAAYSSWSKDKEQSDAKENIPTAGKPTIPTQPNIPNRPKIEPLAPAKGNSPKVKYYEGGLSDKGKPYGSEFGKKPYTWPPIAPKIPEKEVFAFLVENSSDTLAQKESIINIISQTVESKKDAIFLFVKVGNDKTPFSPMDYKAVKEKDIISSLITKSETDELPNLASALFYLVNNLNVFAADSFSFAKTKYKLGTCSIVCIGTGACIQNENSSEIISSCISKLQKISKLKAFKYFCIKDSDAIRVSALGFPVIGHMVSNFYE